MEEFTNRLWVKIKEVQRFIEITVQGSMDGWWREITIWILTDRKSNKTSFICILLCLLGKTVIINTKSLDEEAKQFKDQGQTHEY